MSDINIPKYDDFKDSVVAFVDILGFDSLVKNIKNENEFFNVARVVESVRATAEQLTANRDVFNQFEVTAVSDSFILSAPYNDPICMYGIVSILHKMQYELVATNLSTLTRGYIARGNVYHKSGVIFGSAYSAAYDGEKNIIGSPPRIVIAPEIVEAGKKAVSNHEGEKPISTVFDFLSEDKDGFYFIDYLNPVGSQSLLSKEQLIKERETIKFFVNTNLTKYRFNSKIYAKYSWLNSYINESEKYFLM